MARDLALAREKAAGLRNNVAPEGQLGAGERRLMEREADALEPDNLSMGELNARRAEYGKAHARPGSTADEAQAYRAMHGEANDLLEQEISRANPGAGDRWREAGRNQANAIDVREGVTDAMATTDRRPIMNLRGGMAAGAGGMVAGLPGMAIGWLADRLSTGRENAIAAYGAEKLLNVPKSIFGRALRGKNTAGRLAAAGSAEEAAREHFTASGTDHGYQKDVYAEQSEE
jgi:hypothetical protein